MAWGGARNNRDLRCRVNAMVPLPFCHDARHSLYVSFTSGSSMETRPASAGETGQALRALLGKRFTRYLPADKSRPEGYYDDATGFDDVPSKKAHRRPNTGPGWAIRSPDPHGFERSGFNTSACLAA